MARRRKHKPRRLASGAGSARVHGLEAPAGFERIRVVDQDGRASTVIRREDNLWRLRGALGGERVAGLMALRAAFEATEQGLTGRCALDLSPRGATREDAIGWRIEDAAWCKLLWEAVPETARRVAHAVVVEGAAVRALTGDIGGGATTARLRVYKHLRAAADGVNAALDARFGRARITHVRDD